MCRIMGNLAASRSIAGGPQTNRSRVKNFIGDLTRSQRAQTARGNMQPIGFSSLGAKADYSEDRLGGTSRRWVRRKSIVSRHISGV